MKLSGLSVPPSLSTLFTIFTLFTLLVFSPVATSVQFYRPLQQLHRWSNGRLKSRTTVTAPVSTPSSTRGADSRRGDARLGVYFKELYDQIWGRHRHQTTRGPRPSLSFPPPSSIPPADVASRLAALIPPGGTLDDIPKSQLAILTGDPDYTRFRQTFLREMCRRLLDGPKASNYQFCFSILAF